MSKMSKPITDEEFDNTLLEILSKYTADQMIDIPGIYEILSEHYNNEVIDTVIRKRGE